MSGHGRVQRGRGGGGGGGGGEKGEASLVLRYHCVSVLQLSAVWMFVDVFGPETPDSENGPVKK